MKMDIRYCVVSLLVMAMMEVAAFSEELSLKYKRAEILDEIVVTARGTGSRISQTPGGVGVVNGEIISENQPVSLSNVIRRIPGVEKSSDSAWGSAINIRGLGRNSVVFLIDGCRVNTATDINAQLGLVNPLDIERIEVLKGPISALYGSGSMGGVVNVITKKGSFTPTPQCHGEAALNYTDNPQGAGTYGNIAFTSPDQWLFSSGSYRDHDSYVAGDGDEILNSQFQDYHAKASTGLKWNSLNVTEFCGQYSEAGNVGIPGKGLSLPLGPDVTYSKASLALFNLTHTFAPEGLFLRESKIRLFYQQIQRRVCIDNFPESYAMTENRPGADHETWGLKWQNRFDLESHAFVAGVDIWNWEIGDSQRYKTLKNSLTGVDSSLGDVEQFSGGIFAEDDWQMGDFFALNMGGRIDYIKANSNDLYNWIKPPSSSVPLVLKREGDNYDDVSWNAHAGLTWNFVQGWSMTFISASSYRAPDLMDRFKYINLGGGVELFGSPDLEPERSLFFEYGLHYNTRRLRSTASIYSNYLNDLITEKVVSDTVHRMDNVDEARIYGAEFELEWSFLSEWNAYMNVAFTDGENTKNHEDLAFIPPINGLVGICYKHNHGDGGLDTGFWGRVEMEWAARQDDVPPGGMESGSWETMNIRAGYRLQVGQFFHEIMVGVDNLFDRDFRNYLSTSRDIELKEPGLSFLAAYKMIF